MEFSVYQISYLIGLVSFLGLVAILLINWKNSPYSLGLVMAAAASVLWMASIIVQSSGAIPAWLPVNLEFLRNISWLYFLALVHGIPAGRSGLIGRNGFFGLIAIIVIIAVTAQLPVIQLDPGTRLLLTAICFISLCVGVLLLLENLFRNSDRDSRWAVKFLCFGLGTIFIYDFFYYADAVLFKGLKNVLFDARGMVNAVAVPLIAVAVTRSKGWGIPLHVSRNVVFHTAALIGCGLYLLAMSGAGYYVQAFGGSWGTTLQITFVVCAILLLFTVFSSGTMRAKVRLFISRNFYSVKYDYRAEWLRFIRTLAQDDNNSNLQTRIIEGITQVIDSRAGVIYEKDISSRKYLVSASWNFGENFPPLAMDSDFIRLIEASPDIVMLRDNSKLDRLAPGGFRDWIENYERAWFILPMHYGADLPAFMIVGQPRTHIKLTIEDKELLITLANQAASYVAEERAARALIDARQFEDFNKRVAFVVHDIKNIINQLALMVRNAEKHGHNAEFQQDMLATVDSSVKRMTQLLQQLRSKQDPDSGAIGPVDLTPYLLKIGKDWMNEHGRIELDIDADGARVLGHSAKLSSAICHLLQNAEDAAGQNGQVALRSRVNGNHACIDICDNGAGMDEEFVRTELFRPMSSTKETGFGIGVYQVREYVREMGGDLTVFSTPGEGTTMQIMLPLCSPDETAGQR